MATDVTTGPEIIGTAAGFVAFCVAGMAITRGLSYPMWRRWAGARRATRMLRISMWALIVLALIGVVAIIVGLVSWMTGATYRTT